MVFLFSREHSDVATKLRHKGFRKMGSKQEEAFYDSVMPQKSSGNSKEDVWVRVARKAAQTHLPVPGTMVNIV